MSFYPPEIDARFCSPRFAGRLADAGATGVAANFSCGSVVRVELSVDAQTKVIEAVRFTSNGCGFAIAAADVVAGTLEGRRTTDFHGDLQTELTRALGSAFGGENSRPDCAAIAVEAARLALADVRTRLTREFAGDDALICACFGVGEQEISAAIGNGAATVGDVGDVCRAGLGCGSCRMLIDEMLDAAQFQDFSGA